jgi:flagellar biosynthetic protein FliO
MKFPPCTTFLILLLVASIVPLVQAAGADTNSASTPSLSPGGSSADLLVSVLRMVGALVFVITLFIAGAWFFKRSRFFSLYQGGPAQLKILESRSLGYRNNLMVVAYSQQRFLVAVSATGVNLLTALPNDVPSGVQSGASPSFDEHLANVQERKA